MKLLLTVSFLGTNYCGFQAQPSGRSVQQTLNRACDECFAAACTVTGCSRTDAGVHANRYMAVLGLPEEANRIPRERIPQALNRFLPDDIAVREARPVGEEFHPRYTPHTKEYVYLIHNSRTRDPFLAGRAWQYPRPLDERLMDGEAQAFVGRHDFAAFMAAGSDIEDTVRTVLSFRVTREDELIRMTVSGDGFLYNQVRIMAGTLVAISEGKIARGELPSVLRSLDRSRAGMTLPACGLYLNRVDYAVPV